MRMKKYYLTITGTNYYHGTKFLETGMEVCLEKDYNNDYDSEAIMVKLPGLGKIGYIANSPSTVIGESISAGRLYDKFHRTLQAKVEYVLSDGVICSVSLVDQKYHNVKHF